jgi:predicted DNA-binding transcriptional regulator AlpA
MSELLATTDVAERYGVTVSAVARWCRRGRFPNAWRLGRAWVIPASDLEDFEPPQAGRPPSDEPED